MTEDANQTAVFVSGGARLSDAEDGLNPSGNPPSIVALLALPDADDVAFDPPRMGALFTHAADLD